MNHHNNKCSDLAQWLTFVLSCVLVVVLLPSVACEEDEEPQDENTTPEPKSISATCDGLVPSEGEQVGWWQRVVWQPRFGGPGCRVEVFTEPPISDQIGFAPANGVWAGGLGVQFTRGSESWALQGAQDGGVLRVIRLEEGFLDIGFDSKAFDYTSDTSAEARVVGSARGCDYGARPDCPYITDGGLTKAVSLTLPQENRTIYGDQTYASYCRALIDPDTKGLQVEMQLGVVNGVNVGRWSDQCQTTQSFPNHFVFRSGGVDGFGDFGPYTTRDLPGVNGGAGATLPAFSMTLPVSYFGGFRACGALAEQDITLSSTPNLTTCTWTLTERPGRFDLSCENVSFNDPGYANAIQLDGPQPFSGVGAFRLRADCDVIVR